MSFLKRKKGEAYTSRYIQMNLFEEEGAPAPSVVRSSKGDTPDSLIKYNSAGGSHSEVQTKSEKGEYLKVRVVAETHAGHLILFDETPGNERLYMIHPNGSYVDIIPTGKQDKTEGDLCQFVSKNWKVEVKTDRITFIHNDETVTIDNNRTITVGNNETTKIGNNKADDIGSNWTVNVGSNCKINAGSLVQVTAPKITLN